MVLVDDDDGGWRTVEKYGSYELGVMAELNVCQLSTQATSGLVFLLVVGLTF